MAKGCYVVIANGLFACVNLVVTFEMNALNIIVSVLAYLRDRPQAMLADCAYVSFLLLTRQKDSLVNQHVFIHSFRQTSGFASACIKYLKRNTLRAVWQSVFFFLEGYVLTCLAKLTFILSYIDIYIV